MEAKEINKIPIPVFLESIGVLPERKFNGYWIYKSFINTNQKTGSLKISDKGLWVDYSLNNIGGTLIDLILMIYPLLTVRDIVLKFNTGHFSFHQQENVIAIEKKKENTIHILGEHTIDERPELIKYLTIERGITNLKMTSRYIKVYHYTNLNSGIEYWNLGTTNCKDGYNMFARNFKTVTKQGYTLFENLSTQSRIYFEGIIDFLSFLMIYPDQELLHDYCILNTVNNLKMSFENLRLKEKTICFLDRDLAGDKASLLLKSETEKYGSKFYDYRSTFKGKDLNDYLLGNYEE